MRACGAEWKSAKAEGRVPAGRRSGARSGASATSARRRRGCKAPPALTGRGDLSDRLTWLAPPETRAANQSGRRRDQTRGRLLAIHDDGDCRTGSTYRRAFWGPAAAKDPTDADWMIRMMVCAQQNSPHMEVYLPQSIVFGKKPLAEGPLARPVVAITRSTSATRTRANRSNR